MEIVQDLEHHDVNIRNEPVIEFLELFRLCGTQFFTLQERIQYVLPIVTIRSSPAAKAEYTMNVPSGTSEAHVLTSLGWLTLGVDEQQIQLIDSYNHPIILNNIVHSAITRANVARFAQIEETLSKNNYWIEKFLLLGIGKAIGLLLRHGHPNDLLRHLLTSNRMPNLFLNSRAVWSGFCRIVNCNAIDTLFEQHELPDMIGNLLNNTI